MIRKQIIMVILGLALLSISVPVSAGVPDSLVSFQGELQNTDGTPIPDGMQTIIFSLYTQPDGGVAVWSEIQDVTVSGELFSVLLGRHTPFHNFTFDNDSLFLATQVAGGTELSPRLRIGTVPYAVKSSRVDGDVVTQPGSMEIWSPSSNTSLRFHSTDDAASIAIDEPGAHITQMVSPDSTVFDQGSDSNNRVMIHKIHMGEKRSTQIIYPDSLVAEQSTVFGSSSAGNELHLSASGARRNYHYAHVDAINEIDEDCDGFAAKHAINTKGTGGTRTMSVSSITDLSSASSVIGGDLDGDGLPDLVVSNTIVPEAASVAIKTKGTGADKDRVVATCSTGAGGMASLVCDHDSDGDGVPEQEISSVCIPTSSRMAIKTKGTGAAHNRTTTVSSSTDELGAVSVCATDLDGDGISEVSDSSVVGIDAARRRLSSSGIGSSGEDGVEITPISAARRLAVHNIGSSGQDGVDVTSSSVVHQCDTDLDGDGITEAKAVSAVGNLGGGGGGAAAASYARYSIDSDDDGDDDCDASLAVTPTTSSVAIKTKGTGADANRTMSVTSSTNELSASSVCAGDLDGDGIPENFIEQRCSPDSVVQNAGIDAGGSSSSYNLRVRLNELEARLMNLGLLHSSAVSTACDASGARLAINSKGTSAKRLRAGGDCDDGDAVMYVDCDDDDDGLSDRSVSSTADDSASVISADQGGLSVSMGTRKGWDGTIKGNMRVSNGSVDVVDLDSDGDGFFAGNVGIGMPATTHHIEVAGGAYCDGSNWVNASDANLKENFSEVNGEELLSKIDELPVSEWNYKNDIQNVKHIGPTAQDFQKTFGVGSDGKSISTIDPSGIALAAIKELNKQNQQLQNQNSELQQRLEDLQKKVDKLISRQ